MGFHSSDEVDYTLDHVAVMNTVKRGIEHLENKLQLMVQLCKRDEEETGAQVQLSELELAMKTVNYYLKCTRSEFQRVSFLL